MRPAAGALLLALCSVSAAAHNVDSDDDASFAAAGRLFRFDYANDFFAARDRYYTQGYGFDLFHPGLAKWPLMRLLAALPGGERSYGLTFRQSGFTPTSLSSDLVLKGDRPFASYLFLGHVLLSRDPGRGLTLTTEFDVGVIGQGAGGKWIQEGLHSALGNLAPHGWDNQIRNDAVLDYYIRLEKSLASASRADAGIFVDATAGQPYTNAAAGLMARLGTIADGPKRGYLFGRVEEKVIAYDATLQGGLLNRHSPYTLSAAQVERAVTRGDIGVVYDRGGVALEYSRSFLGREFRDGLAHQWGEFSVMARF